MGWLTTPKRFSRPDPVRLVFVFIAAVAFVATELGRFRYRPWVRESGIEDFGLADSVGNLGGIVVQIFVTLAAVNATRLQSYRLAVFLAGGYVLYEFVQPLLPRGWFDWKDIAATAIGLGVACALLALIWLRFPHGDDEHEEGHPQADA